MSGTKEGGKKTAATNKERYGEDYYIRMGRKGGQNGHTGGFASNRELARIAGAKGGKKSRRTGVKNGQGHGTTKKKTKKTTNERTHHVTVFKETAVVERPSKKGIFSKIFGRKDG
jgi:general stress protein YciG